MKTEVIDGITVKTDPGLVVPGFVEISFYLPEVIKGAGPILTAVVSRQCKGGKWEAQGNSGAGLLCRTPVKRRAMRAALDHASKIKAQQSHLRA